MENTDKKTILSGIQPTGVSFTLGNFLGAIRCWAQMQEEYNCLTFIADLHAITIRQEPSLFRKQIFDCFTLLLACGMDPEKSALFVQSQVHAHAELAWVLGCYTQFGELSRMTQFKDKSTKYPENINSGLFTYPILQAADILLYQPHYVPVGEDQKQHLELARNIAVRFNHNHGDVFTIPAPYISKSGGKINSLADPSKKMSKSDQNINAYISILDPPEVIIKKFKRAVTDSENKIVFKDDIEKRGINNLITIYSLSTGNSISDIENEFANNGYGDFKLAVGEAVVELLRPIREKFEIYNKDKAYIQECQQKGAEKAAALAARTLRKVYRKVGLR
ncbi:MAG: tryptophan--tRNA ligase [Oscillospiraceae bacterium]|nr:tryptophan--tRNA ligase [Oscillospiraceae bacterium]